VDIQPSKDEKLAGNKKKNELDCNIHPEGPYLTNAGSLGAGRIKNRNGETV